MPHDSHPPVAPLTFQVMTALPEIASLAVEWDSLLERSTCNRAFSSPSWFIASCQYNPSMSPYVVVARRGAALAGILPLVLTDEGRLAHFSNYLNDYSDMVVARTDTAAGAGLLNYAYTEPNGYTRLLLSHLRRDSNCATVLPAMAWGSNGTHPYHENGLCYYLCLPVGYEAFLKTKGSRFRKRLKRLRLRAETSRFTVHELKPESFSPETLAEVFLLLHLHRQPVGSCFRPSAAQSFVTDVIPQLFRSGVVRACALLEGQRIVAIDLYTMGSNSLCAWNGGFLSEAEHCSPGRLLVDAGIRLACSMGLEEFDFMRGPEAYKTNWATNSRSIGQVELIIQGR